MAIFSRRTIQKLINENADFLTKTQTRKHVDLLNLNKKTNRESLEDGKYINDLIKDYLSTEWEIVLLNSLSKFGKIIHEKRVGKSKPDIFFTSSQHNFKFVGDITCITGKQDQHNISLAFRNEFKEIIDKENLSGYWRISIYGNSREMDFCRVKPRLMLGGKTQREEILSSKEFNTFIERVKKNCKTKHSFTYTKNKENPEPLPASQIELYRNVIVDIRIEYEPRDFYQIEYSQFDDRKITIIENDEIYGSLLNKYNQLAKTNYNGCLGVFPCDSIGNTFNRGDLVYKSSREVIHNFLHNHKEIDFVLTVNSETEPYNFYDQEAKIKITLFQRLRK